MVSFEFFIAIMLPASLLPRVDSVANRNEYQEYFLEGKEGRCVGLTTLPPSCADCLEIWEPQTPGTLRACPGLYRDSFTFTFTICFGCPYQPSSGRCRIDKKNVKG